MIISIASGKGGTGKTTVATNLAVSVDGPVQLLDCDVEEPNAHLFLHPFIEETKTVTTPVPQIDPEACNQCKKCMEICRFRAITVIGDMVLTFPELCHSCGGCMAICPEGAIRETGRELGVLETGHRDGVAFAHGRLRVGEAMAPPLIRAVRDCARTDGLILIDAPPGTSCPVIEAIRGADFVVLVTEPTPFGFHDLQLAVEMVRVLRLPLGVVINRTRLNGTDVRSYCTARRIPILQEIPDDRKLAEAYSRGVMACEALPEYQAVFAGLLKSVRATEGGAG